MTTGAPAPDETEALPAPRTALVADALDTLGLRDQVLDSAIQASAPHVRIAGYAVPMLVHPTDRVPEEPYSSEMNAVHALSANHVPVYCVEGEDVRAALWGELFSCAAIGRGAVGTIVDGYVRDLRQMLELDYPVFSRGACPLDTLGRAEVVESNTPGICGGVRVAPGDYVVADCDGVVVVPSAALGDVLEYANRTERDENGALGDLRAGASIHEVWERWGVL